MRTAPARMLWVVALATALAGCGYNRLTAMQESIASAWAQVDNQLQRRNDLIPNLVNVVKGYAAHEASIFKEIADARARMLAASTPEQKMAASDAMTGPLGRLLALGERYPDLKANTQFTQLADELAGTENRIAVERMRYNDAVRAYNTYLKTFPTVLYARFLGFKEHDYFAAAPGAKEVPKVDFGTGGAPAPAPAGGH